MSSAPPSRKEARNSHAHTRSKEREKMLEGWRMVSVDMDH